MQWTGQAILSTPQRRTSDDYPTPAWVTELLLLHCPPPQNMPLLEPSAGEGGMLSVLIRAGYSNLYACELRATCRDILVGVTGSRERVTIGDFSAQARKYEQLTGKVAIVANPPYCEADRQLRTALSLKPVYCAFLLNTQYFATRNRRGLFQDCKPARIMVINRRVSFTGNSRCSGLSTAWYVWIAGDHAAKMDVISDQDLPAKA